MEKLGKVFAWIIIVTLFGIIVYAAFFSDDPFLKALGKIFGIILPWLKGLT